MTTSMPQTASSVEWYRAHVIRFCVLVWMPFMLTVPVGCEYNSVKPGLLFLSTAYVLISQSCFR